MKQIFLITIIVIFSCTVFANIDVQFMSTDRESGLSQQEEIKLIEITKAVLSHENSNIISNKKYSIARIQLLKSKQQKYILVHLLEKYFLRYKLIRINITNDNKIQSVIKNYQLKPSDFVAEGEDFVSSSPICPAEYQQGKPLFVVATPLPYEKDKGSLHSSIKLLITNILKTNKYQLVTLFDSHATIASYENILACPNLKYFFHIGHSNGKYLQLFDGDFNSDYFIKNPQLHYNKTALFFDSCLAFDEIPQGICPLITQTTHWPMAYSSGISELLIWGSPETYSCFWNNVLKGLPLSKDTLEKCAFQNDPSVKNSQAGIYFLGDYDDNATINVIVTTNKRTIIIPPWHDSIVKLASGELITKYQIKVSSHLITCSSESDQIPLINNPNLKSAEYAFDYDSYTNLCYYFAITHHQKTSEMTGDIYGFYPKDICYQSNAR